MTNPADRLSERFLVLRCQAGDDAAFEELVVSFSPRLRYYLRKMLRELDCADDVLQDVWIQVLRGLPTLADTGAFRGWLYRIARDRAYREFRKRSAPVRQLEDSDLPAGPESNGDISAEHIEQIHAALDQLAREHREVLVLRYLEDMSYDDIARVTGCPLGTVRSRIHYAKTALRRVLERDERS
jgi:RNA polymerase sigma-70 factor (ECF subfamily)